MRGGFTGAFLCALMASGCMAFQALALDNRAAPPQQLETVPVAGGCDNNLAALPGQGKEYDLFKNLAGAQRGCTPPSQVTYQKIDSPPSQAGGRPVSPQQEEIDRAACRSEGEQAAHAATGLRPGEYDIFKSNFASRSGDVQKVEQSCMAQRGYRSMAN